MKKLIHLLAQYFWWIRTMPQLPYQPLSQWQARKICNFKTYIRWRFGKDWQNKLAAGTGVEPSQLLKFVNTCNTAFVGPPIDLCDEYYTQKTLTANP